MRVLRYGRHAALLELDDLDQVVGLREELRTDPPPGVVELVPAARTLLIAYDPQATTFEQLRTVVIDRRPAPVTAPDRPLVELPVVYDGPDLAEVARLSGLAVPEVVERHVEREYVVAFCGFTPGFAYLTGGDAALRVPRRSSPRTRVPAGSVAIADEYTGVYPREVPGGWNLLGRTDAPLWDLDRDPPALLVPGTRVRLLEASA